MSDRHPADPPHRIVGYGLIASVWLALIDLTALTVLITRVDPGRYKVAGALVIACTKVGLVMLLFMHMKYEGRLLRWLLFIPLATLALFIGLTFFDVLFR